VFRVVERLEGSGLPLRITLCAALIKFDRFEWMVEKATELGVERILPVESARCEKGLMEASRKRTERWVRIARESSQQARRVRVPEILPAVRFDRALHEAADQRYFLDEEATTPILNALADVKNPGDRVAMLVGPEGGWTEAERAAAAGAEWRTVSLAQHVLRAETASMAAVTILTNAWIAAASLK
jgi:16S rRNA (uracil1498-N3)-methyltransferase